MTTSRQPPITFRRFAASFLCDVAYCTTPMPSELAGLIRILRRDFGVDYRDLGYYLCVTDPDPGAAFGLGKALTDLASRELNDPDPAWV
jgi:hypothetical protein